MPFLSVFVAPYFFKTLMFNTSLSLLESSGVMLQGNGNAVVLLP